MLNFHRSLPVDHRELASIQKRQTFENERKARIFNARNRLIGVDEEALAQQVAERKAREEEERLLNAKYDEQASKQAQIAQLLEKKSKDDNRQLNKEIEIFRATYQKPEDRREFDLYDPDGLKKSIPARVQDDDPRLGPSSLQKFAGEDADAKVRIKVQKEQQRAWLEQQIAERRKADTDRQKAEEAYTTMMKVCDQRASQMDKAERACKRALNQAIADYNKALASEQEARNKLEETQEQEDNMAEIYNATTGDFLTEDPAAAVGTLGPSRLIRSKFKGMLPEQVAEIRQEQLRQIEENKLKREAEAKRETDWTHFTNGVARIAELKEREIMRDQRELNKKILQQNKALSEEQRAKLEYLEKTVYTTSVPNDFFDLFNTTTR